MHKKANQFYDAKRKVKEVVSDIAAEVIDKKTIIPKKTAKVGNECGYQRLTHMIT